MGAHDGLLTPADRGCLVIGDVSGYTDYLHETELEHAQDVLADLTETLVSHLTPTLRLSKLEGDAAFTYALESEIEASMLLDTIEETYFAFRSRVRDIDQATSCQCNACRLIPELNLKFVVHHGRFVRQQVAGGEELTGPDVILVHRLLKNSVRERFGLRGYAVFTQPCIEALEIHPAALDMREHRETGLETGNVVTYVEDLEARWRYEDERRRVFVVPSEAEFEERVTLHAPPKVAWEFLTSPQKRPLWQSDVSRIDEDTATGRRGPGTTNHCVHGRSAIVQEILDWRPFHYYTYRSHFPVIGPWTWTYQLQPVDEDQTELLLRPEKLQGVRKRLAWRLMRRRILAKGQRDVENLNGLLEAHRAQMTTAAAVG